MTTPRFQAVLCFWCRNPRGDKRVAEPNDGRDQVIVDYQPCAQCIAERNEGITFVEVSTAPNFVGQPSLLEGLPKEAVVNDVTPGAIPGRPVLPVYPTGNSLVFNPDGLAECFSQEFVEALGDGRQVLLPVEVYQGTFGMAIEAAEMVDSIVN